MSNYTFIKHRDESNRFDLSTITMDVEAVCISEVITEFADFLKASGYAEKTVNEALGLDISEEEE